MRQLKATIAGLCAAAVLAGCAAPPPGPTVQVMPAPNKPFNVFSEDDVLCRSYAQNTIAGQAEAANNSQVGSAVIGTVLGAGLGAALGGGRGAAIGAASGAALGTGYGAANAQGAQLSIQQRYDIAYAQCMYSRGNQVPGFAPGPGYPPPPPPGYPPPPPPR